ncbi:MAG: TIGR02206 family membrane protein [Gemmatimonadetes bacterium]|nr:TIGR02206 family membrane protein [Gemmatimonadota bacterium]
MPAPPFDLFGFAHIVAVVIAVGVPAVLAAFVKRADSERVTRAVSVTLALVILVNQIVYWCYRFATEGAVLFVREHLPLHLCGITILLSVATLLFRHRRTYELTYFWGLAGATNAIVTPELTEGFPTYLFFQYFISHAGIVGAALFATWGLGMRPTFKSLVRAFVVLNGIAVPVAVVNLALDGNYMYLCAPPVTASPFLFLPWPWYLLIIEVLGLIFFLLLYLPVHLGARRRSRRP